MKSNQRIVHKILWFFFLSAALLPVCILYFSEEAGAFFKGTAFCNATFAFGYTIVMSMTSLLFFKLGFVGAGRRGHPLEVPFKHLWRRAKGSDP